MPTQNSIKIVIYDQENCIWSHPEPFDVNNKIEYVTIADPSDTPILRFYITAESPTTPVFGIWYKLEHVNEMMIPGDPQPGDIECFRADFAEAPLTISKSDKTIMMPRPGGKAPIRVPLFKVSHPLSFEMHKGLRGYPMEMELPSDRGVRLTVTARPEYGDPWALSMDFIRYYSYI